MDNAGAYFVTTVLKAHEPFTTRRHSSVGCGIMTRVKSPFPGMDPYLEPHWLDVHSSLAIGARDALNRALPADLIASVEERVAIESETGGDQLFGPDVRVFEPPADETMIIENPADAAVIAPFRVLAQVEPITERFVRVVEAGSERLVTVIEFVSSTNKRGEGLHLFRSKRGELLASGVNFVEIDLVRAGDWRALMRPHRAGKRITTTYRVTFRVPKDPAAVYIHPIRLRDRLPSIVIPLRERDPQIKLDLQDLLDHAYSSGRYEKRINYRKAPEPPLEADDAAWADQLLKSVEKH